MTHTDRARLAHADLDAPAAMQADCAAAGAHLPLARAARRVTRPAPGLGFDDFPREVAKRDIRVDEAASRLARSLHLETE